MSEAADDRSESIRAAAAAVNGGNLVVYPTETVYGLGADALSPLAIERVYEAKDRPRDRPLSMAVPTVSSAFDYIRPTERVRACLEAFLPGPVTVIAERDPIVPDALTGGRSHVGIRVPDHELALALLRRAAPLTATSANRSGAGSVRHPDGLDPTIRDRVAVVLDDGETPGIESTVVDPDRGELLRRGARADAVAAWLDGSG